MRDASPRISNSRSAGPRSLTTLVALLAAFVVPLALSAPPASAHLVHGPISYEFGIDGTSATSFNGTGPLAYQQSSKRLYVQSEQKIYAFEHPSAKTFTPVAGNFPVEVTTYPESSGMAVDNTAGPTAGHLIWTGFGSQIRGYDSSGETLAGFPVSPEAETCGAAVDNEGHIWAASYYGEGVFEYAADGTPMRLVPTPEIGHPCRVAIDESDNDIYITSYSENKFARLTAASNYTTESVVEVPGAYNSAIAVNGSRHAVYVATPYTSFPEIAVFDTSTLAPVESFQTSANALGISVAEATDTLFVAVSESHGEYRPVIQEMPSADVPVAATDPPPSNSTAAGTADPDGPAPITECYFEYGTEAPAYGEKVDCEQPLPITSVTSVTAKLPLLGEKTYHYRLVLANAEGPARGEDETIVAHNILDFSTQAATDVTRTTATLNGEFTGTNEDTTYYFKYGTEESYGSRVPASPAEGDAGVTSVPTTISEGVTGLLPDTVYHFRAFGKNPKGSNEGSDMTFRTAKAVGGMKTGLPTDVTGTTATLNGSFTGSGENTTFYFEWGQSGSYGHSTPVESAGNGTGTIEVSAPIEGLEPDQPGTVSYHYRLVATNPVGTTYGPDRPFTTAAPDPPTVAGEQATGVTPTEATIGASINPSQSETVFLVEYGTTQNYGSVTATSASIGSDATGHQVSESLTGLTPGTAYHYRVVAFSFGGTAHGADQIFETPAPPRIESTSASGVTKSAALLHAEINAGGLPTAVHFEYGPSTSYGNSTATQQLGGSLGFTEVEAQLAGLAAGTTYHVRAVATNALATATSPDVTLTTAPAPPVTTPIVKCKKGFVKKHGKCVKKPKPKKKKRNHHHHG